MKKFGLAAMVLLGGMLLSTANQAFAGGVGYIDYQKVQASYPLAQQAVKEVDAKALELQQYMVDKEKQYKALDTPLKKQNFEDATAREFNAKQEAYLKLKSQKKNLFSIKFRQQQNRFL